MKKLDTGLKISLELNEKGEQVQLLELSWIMSEYPAMDFTKEAVAEMTQLLEDYIEDTSNNSI